MAQAKKPAAKKTTAKSTSKAAVTKKAPVKKAVTKKAPAKKAPTRKATVKKTPAKSAELRSFRVARNQPSFTTFRITKQTVYWIILVAFIIFAQLWILKLQVEVTSLLEAQQVQLRNEF
ncbi:MAG: hypothetical protein ACREGE_02410 [Candidatus Microsaccharimonas sp.]